MFSSLFGKRKKEPAVAAAPAPAAATTATDAAAVSTAGETPAGTPTDAPPADSTTSIPPVDNPGGLNLDALFAPRPESEAPAQPTIGPPDTARTEALKPQVVEALSTIYDPEIPVNIYELGLVYDIIVDADNNVGVRMTLTSPACPSAQQLPSEARYKVKAVPGVTDCAVDIVWDPPWTKDMMSEEAKLALGIY